MVKSRKDRVSIVVGSTFVFRSILDKLNALPVEALGMENVCIQVVNLPQTGEWSAVVKGSVTVGQKMKLVEGLKKSYNVMLVDDLEMEIDKSVVFGVGVN